MPFSAAACFGSPMPRGLDRDQRLDLVGPRLRHLEAELPGLRMEQDHARADAVDQRRVGGG